MRRLLGLYSLAWLVLCIACSRDSQKLGTHFELELRPPARIEKIKPATILMYREEELRQNKAYVEQVDKIFRTFSERQLEAFEDAELGFWSSYGNMFSYLFSSKEEWRSRWRLKHNLYFNDLDLSQELYTLHRGYSNNVGLLRQQIVGQAKSSRSIAPFQELELEQQRLSLSEAVGAYARNNALIEVADFFAEWLITLLLVAILAQVASLALTAGTWGAAAPCTIPVFIITFALSVGLSWYNDSVLMDALREQNKRAITYDKEAELKRLNEYTNAFYEQI